MLVSETAGAELKILACFWLAHTYLFEGESERAEQAIAEIFSIVADPEHDYLKGLPESIRGNSRLMYFFNRSREELAPAREEEESREVVARKVPEAETVKQKKPSFGKMIVGTLMTAAYIVLVVLL